VLSRGSWLTPRQTHAGTHHAIRTGGEPENSQVCGALAGVVEGSRRHVCGNHQGRSCPRSMWRVVHCHKSISETLSEATPEALVAHTTVLAQMARFKPDAFEHKSDTIMAFLIKKLLMGRRSKVGGTWIPPRWTPDLFQGRHGRRRRLGARRRHGTHAKGQDPRVESVSESVSCQCGCRNRSGACVARA
jgi:hypothetical protein